MSEPNTHSPQPSERGDAPQSDAPRGERGERPASGGGRGGPGRPPGRGGPQARGPGGPGGPRRGGQSVKARLRAKARKKARKQAKARGVAAGSRKKVCRFCADPKLEIDYKDPKGLRYFLTETGKMIPQRISGNCAPHQRKVSVAIKRARQLALMPYGPTHV